MREIKFRVFDKDFKKMRIVGADQHDSLEVDFETKKIFYYNLQNGCGSEIVPGDDSSYVLMQYTGLKDKNGKEIYEGDILKCKCDKKRIQGFNIEREIIYKNSVIEWWESYVNIGYRLRDGKGKTFMVKPSALHTMEVEVIGNIYENPELLEVIE